jgi:hypothetical protein
MWLFVMRSARLAVAALCLRLGGTAVADPTPSTPARFHLPASGKDVCQAGCIGYSPSTRIWLCGIEESAHGMVGAGGTRCALQLLRGTTRIADLTVYAASDSGMDLAESIPLDRVSALLPDDLAPTTTLALRPRVEIKVPGTKHVIRVDTDDMMATKKARKATHGEHAVVTILCNTQPKEEDRSVQGLGGKRLTPGPPKAVVVRRWPGDECALHTDYQLQLGPEPSQVILLEQADWGCVDFDVLRRNVHPVDVAAVCQAPPFKPQKTR